MDHGNPTLPIPNLSLCTRLSRGLEVGHCHEERSGRPVLERKKKKKRFTVLLVEMIT